MTNKMIETNFNDYKQILKADAVRVYDLIGYFKKEEIDYDRYGNIFIGFNEKSKGLPILVAHTDNVLDADKEPIYDLNKRFISGKKNGIGFDDKAGIISIIELWKHYKTQRFRIIFPTDEETGGNGSKLIDPRVYEDAAWMIELDRKGNKDLIQTSGMTRLCSDEFASKWEKMGFKKAQGSFTDLNVFKPNTPTINMANLSIAYYNPHSDAEYLDTIEFNKIVNKVKDFIDADYTFEDDVEDKKPDFNSLSGQPKWWDEPDDEFCAMCGDWCDKRDSIEFNGERFCCQACLDDYKRYMGIK